MIDDQLRPVGPGPRPPVDGFVLVVAAARRRRWRTIRTNAACATAAVAAVVATTMPGLTASTTSGLEPTAPRPTYASPVPSATPGTPAPTPSPTPTPPADPVAYGAAPARYGTAAAPYGPAAPQRSGTAAGPAGPGPERTTPPPDGGGPWPTAAPEPEPEPEPEPTDPPATPEPPSPSPSARPSPDPEPVDQSMEDQPAHDVCETSAWCVDAQVAAGSGGSYTFRLRACRPASDSSGVLRFAMEDEADFRVVRDGVEVWRWSDGQRDRTWNHEVFVDRWQCAVWTTTWWRNDSSGAPVAAGTYRLDALSRATNLPAVWHTRSFTVTP